MEILADPQSLNSYAYARNNPLTYIDQDGNFAFLAPLAVGAVAITPYLAAIAHTIPAYIDNWQTTARYAPYTGDASDFAEAATGKDVFTGQNLSTTDRVLSSVGVGLPFVSGAMLRRGADAIQSSGVDNIKNIFMPNGRLIGKQGSDQAIREINNSSFNDAWSMFTKASEGGQYLQNSKYPGIMMKVGDNTYVGIRDFHTGSPNTHTTIDITTGNSTVKFKFNK